MPEELKVAEPVVWRYTPQLSLPQGLLQRLSSGFSSVWAATAFKGATSSCASVPPIRL